TPENGGAKSAGSGAGFDAAAGRKLRRARSAAREVGARHRYPAPRPEKKGVRHHFSGKRRGNDPDAVLEKMVSDTIFGIRQARPETAVASAGRRRTMPASGPTPRIHSPPASRQELRWPEASIKSF